METTKKGLVLEGGGMRGIFTTGVLDCFLREGITFDSCVAVSAGACHACSYLSKQLGRGFDTAVEFLHDKRYCSLYSLLTTGDMFGADFIYNIIPNQYYPIDNAAFLASGTEFRVVVTNCNTGKAEYPLLQNLTEDVCYVRASSSLPFISRIVRIQGKPYLDGGLADSIPLVKSLSLGNRKNVVVLTQPEGYRKEPSKNREMMYLRYRQYPKLIASMKNRHLHYNKTLELVESLEQEGKIFVIRPRKSLGIGRIEKDQEKLSRVYSLGYAMAKRRVAALRKYLAE